jgi:hypothetical protein
MKYISTFELFEGYNKPRAGGKRRWTVKYKKKINCNNPKGFSQKQYCKRKRRGGNYKNESLNESDYYHALEVMDVLVDMSLELWDDNFNVQVAPKIITEDDRYIRVAMQKKSEPSPLGMYGATRFDYNKIKDVLLTMISYMEDEGYTIKEIEVSEKYAHTLIPVELKEEKLYLKYRPEQMVDYQIGQLVINFKEQ